MLYLWSSFWLWWVYLSLWWFVGSIFIFGNPWILWDNLFIFPKWLLRVVNNRDKSANVYFDYMPKYQLTPTVIIRWNTSIAGWEMNKLGLLKKNPWELISFLIYSIHFLVGYSSRSGCLSMLRYIDENRICLARPSYYLKDCLGQLCQFDPCKFRNLMILKIWDTLHPIESWS